PLRGMPLSGGQSANSKRISRRQVTQAMNDASTAPQQPAHGLRVPLQPGLDAVPRAPLEIHRATVLSEWIDYNNHLNLAYYVLMFDHATDRLFDLIDLGIDYVRRYNHSSFVLETHVTYQQELKLDDPLRFTMQLIDADTKRLHYYLEMFHETEGFLAATSEQIALHVDLEARRSVPFPADLKARIDLILAAHADLPRPEGVGRSIAIRRKS
ncbi:MAG: thioesterase family protein, partial [Alphaproteobacteria bacterium]|nr:thioesterase family protein [Alphaproteobacteria bacterium]